ncbi:MAG: hypothetical protein ACFCUN_09250 [Hyphomicrobiaceae bacterium]
MAIASSPGFAQGIEIRGPIEDAPRLQDRTNSGFGTTIIPAEPGRAPSVLDALGLPPVLFEGPGTAAATLSQEPSASGGEGEVGETGRLSLSAQLTETSASLSDGIIWRIFSPGTVISSTPRLRQTVFEAAPVLDLPAGTYYINAAYGRANLTKRITVLARGRLRESFVLNAGGLVANVTIGETVVPPRELVRVDVFSEQSDQSGERIPVVTGLQSGQLVRLNSGIYVLESRLGRANAVVRSEVAILAGKVTEARVRHDAARVSLRLVENAGGEAIAGTQWAILGRGGNVVLESVGALPTHLLAPGDYTAVASVEGRSWRRDFTLVAGRNAAIEVVKTP